MIYPGILLGDASPAYWSSNAFVVGNVTDTLIGDPTFGWTQIALQTNVTFPNGRNPASVWGAPNSKEFTAPSTIDMYITYKFSAYNDSGTDSVITINLYNSTTASTVTTLVSAQTVSSSTTSSAPAVFTGSYTLSATSGDIYFFRAGIGIGDTNLVYMRRNINDPATFVTCYW